MKKYVILLAAGRGNRFNNATPKQYAHISGIPIIVHTLNAFYEAAPDVERILVLNRTDLEVWDQIIQTYNVQIPHRIVYGGEERFYSVKNVLKAISFPDDALIGVHDIVRPFVSKQTIKNAYDSAEKYGAAVPVVNAVNTLRFVEATTNRALNRPQVKVVQNPQVFKYPILKAAFEQNYQEHFFDDATVVESNGQSIWLTEGNYENIKITYPQDIYLAEAILKNTSNKTAYEYLYNWERLVG